jgi:L-alanine-DL-glutamate epimerase-like enolase superfamily enzyme
MLCRCARHWNLIGHTSLRPIAAGEQWVSKCAFKEIIEEELINYARLDLCFVGGFTEALKITHGAETYYIDVVHHNPLSPISAAACVNLCLASTNVGVQEMPRRLGSFAPDLFPSQIDWEGGYAFVEPDTAGLGVGFDEACRDAYRSSHRLGRRNCAETTALSPTGKPAGLRSHR